MVCEPVGGGTFKCGVAHTYSGHVKDVTLAGLPAGTTWNVATEAGAVVATGVTGEVLLPGTFAPWPPTYFLLVRQ